SLSLFPQKTRYAF
ncbi:hypothetical protein D046_5000, partial [Vibrio parahaemolyticus V-223/04]